MLNGSAFDAEPFQPVTTVADVQREINWQADAGVDWIKLYGSLPPNLTRAAIEAAHARGLPVVGHLQRTTWTEAAQMGIDALTHAAPWSPDLLPADARAGYRGDLLARVLWLEQVDPEGPAVTPMIAALREHDVTLDPTLIAMHTKFFGDAARWRANADLALMPALHSRGWPAGSFTASWTAAQYARAQKAWPRLEALIRRYHAAGLRLTTGTDAPTPWIVPGASLHEELALLVDAGLPATDVLQMATSAGAQALRRADRVGTLRPGLQADVVVLSADPLADIHNTRRIEWVVQAGVAHRPADLLAP
jgi:Amidohydrolase family